MQRHKNSKNGLDSRVLGPYFRGEAIMAGTFGQHGQLLVFCNDPSTNKPPIIYGWCDDEPIMTGLKDYDNQEAKRVLQSRVSNLIAVHVDDTAYVVWTKDSEILQVLRDKPDKKRINQDGRVLATLHQSLDKKRISQDGRVMTLHRNLNVTQILAMPGCDYALILGSNQASNESKRNNGLWIWKISYKDIQVFGQFVELGSCHSVHMEDIIHSEAVKGSFFHPYILRIFTSEGVGFEGKFR
jgi:hypothetical protein